MKDLGKEIVEKKRIEYLTELCNGDIFRAQEVMRILYRSHRNERYQNYKHRAYRYEEIDGILYPMKRRTTNARINTKTSESSEFLSQE